jgi:hypothetical protein
MLNGLPLTAAAGEPRDRSDAILVSFKSGWYEPLREGRFSAVIRRQVPVTFTPRYLYFYLSAPRRAVCARAPIVSLQRIDGAQAIGMSADLALTGEEVRDYVGRRRQVGCYELGAIEYPRLEVEPGSYPGTLIFRPPQNYVVLSIRGKRALDDLCDWPSKT